MSINSEQLARVSDASGAEQCWEEVWRDRGVPLEQVQRECVVSNDVMGGLPDAVQDKLRVVLDAVRACSEGPGWLKENGMYFSVEDDDYVLDPRKTMLVSSDGKSGKNSLESVVGRVNVATVSTAAKAVPGGSVAGSVVRNFNEVRLDIVKCVTLIEVVEGCGDFDECRAVYDALMSVRGGAGMLSEAFFAVWVEKCRDVEEGVRVLSEMEEDGSDSARVSTGEATRRYIKPDCAVAVALLLKARNDDEFNRIFSRFAGERFAKSVNFLNMLLRHCENLDACVKVWEKVMANDGTANEDSLKITFNKCRSYADGLRVLESAKSTYKLHSSDPVPEFCWRCFLELASSNANDLVAAVVEMQEYDRAVVLDPKYVKNLAISPEVCIEALRKFEEVFSMKNKVSYAKVGGNPVHNFTVITKPDFESLYGSYVRFGGAGKFKKIVMDVYGCVRLAALYHSEKEVAVCKCCCVDDFMAVVEWMIRDGVEPSENVVDWMSSAEGVKRLHGMIGLRGRLEELFAGGGVCIGDLYQLSRAGAEAGAEAGVGATFDKGKGWVDFYGCVRDAGLVDKVDDLMDFLRVVYEERERAKEAGDDYEYDRVAVPSGEEIERLFKLKRKKGAVVSARIVEFFAKEGYSADSLSDMDEDMGAVYEYFGSEMVVRKRRKV